MVKIGCKFWSTNDFYLDIAQELFERKVFEYIELFTVPGSAEQYLPLWNNLNVPYVLHAPHSYAGLNFSDASKESSNRWMLETVKTFADALHPSQIIYHPGLNGTNQETIRQINLFKIEFPSIFINSCLENKPKMGIAQEVCVGFTPESVAEIAHATGMHTCFDFGHAVAAAASLKIDLYSFVKTFIALKPVIFHLSDGHVASEEDAHLNLGCGDYPLTDFINMLPENAMVSLETTKASKENLDDFVKDVEFVRNGFRVIAFARTSTPLVTPPLVTEPDKRVLKDKIIAIIKKDAQASMNQIADKLGIQRDTVKEYIAQLKKQGRIKRIGRTSAGHWEII